MIHTLYYSDKTNKYYKNEQAAKQAESSETEEENLIKELEHLRSCYRFELDSIRTSYESRISAVLSKLSNIRNR